MPVVNGNGNLIVERLRTPEDEYLSKLEYWRDENAIWDLTPRQFRKWLYGLSPRESMLLTGRRSFKLLMDLKRGKWTLIRSLLWA